MVFARVWSYRLINGNGITQPLDGENTFTLDALYFAGLSKNY